MLELGKTVCQNLAESSSREWLEANGLGGFASSTVAGFNDRRYHALLTAAVRPPVRRMTLLNQFEETLTDDRSSWTLSRHRYASDGGSVIVPENAPPMTGFSLSPWPVWTYETPFWKLEKSVFMVYGQNATVVSYRLLSSARPLRLKARPLLTGRDFHALHRENPQLRSEPSVAGSRVSFEPYPGVPRIFLHHNGRYSPSFYWYRNFFYGKEHERGLDHLEDCWSPGEFAFELEPGQEAFLVATTEPDFEADLAGLRHQERARRQALLHSAENWPVPEEDHAPLRLLLNAADQLVVRRESFKTILAGYPWFNDWGRDSFVSLFGLCLATGRFRIARDILEAFARHVRSGLVPNYFPDSGEEPHYNTVDASLWYVLAGCRYCERSGDLTFARETAWPVFSGILRAYREGTLHRIRMEPDGLIACGDAGTQITWMDSKADGKPVTPRNGKPVEIQALWHNALLALAALGDSIDRKPEAEELRRTAALCRESFGRAFWNGAQGCLYDVIGEDGTADASVRPNQIFALSLPNSLLDPDRMASVLKVVEEQLWTPYGLRSLSPSDPAYRGRYEGCPEERALAYHRGTVWSWLIGPWASAFLRVRGGNPEAKTEVRERLKPLLRHLEEAGLGSVSEIFDGDVPHRPRGCVSQAWSVGELLRVLLQELRKPASLESGDKF